MWARLKISIKGLWQSGLNFRPGAVCDRRALGDEGSEIICEVEVEVNYAYFGRLV